MTCPKCGERTTVIDSKADCEAVHRRRKCRVCGYVFFTVEMEAKSSLEFYELSNEYRRKLKHAQN